MTIHSANTVLYRNSSLILLADHDGGRNHPVTTIQDARLWRRLKEANEASRLGPRKFVSPGFLPFSSFSSSSRDLVVSFAEPCGTPANPQQGTSLDATQRTNHLSRHGYHAIDNADDVYLTVPHPRSRLARRDRQCDRNYPLRQQSLVNGPGRKSLPEPYALAMGREM